MMIGLESCVDAVGQWAHEVEVKVHFRRQTLESLRNKKIKTEKINSRGPVSKIT